MKLIFPPLCTQNEGTKASQRNELRLDIFCQHFIVPIEGVELIVITCVHKVFETK